MPHPAGRLPFLVLHGEQLPAVNDAGNLLLLVEHGQGVGLKLLHDRQDLLHGGVLVAPEWARPQKWFTGSSGLQQRRIRSTTEIAPSQSP